MILDILKDRFAIVAYRGHSVAYPANSPRALVMAVPDADVIMADVTACRNGAMFCTSDERVAKMFFDEVEDMDALPLRMLMNCAKEADRHLLLNPRPMNAIQLQRIVGDARFFGVEDRVSVVTKTLSATKYVSGLSDKIGIVGMMRKPEQYAAFYKAGGHVATLRQNQTTPRNVRLAEATEGRHRHPFLVLAPKAETRDVFNACNGLVGAKGIIMADPEMGREALNRRRAPGPACAGFCPD